MMTWQLPEVSIRRISFRNSIWREGDTAVFDWSGTDPQAPGVSRIGGATLIPTAGLVAGVVLAPLMVIGEGTNEVQRMLIARHLLASR